jgi:hypothetical protein
VCLHGAAVFYLLCLISLFTINKTKHGMMQMRTMKKITPIFYRTSIAGLLALASLSCKEKETASAEPALVAVAPCNLQTERREEMDIQSMGTKFVMEYPENRYELSSFISETEGIVTLCVISGSLVMSYETCNFPESIKERRASDDDLSLIVSGNAFATLRDHGMNVATYSFFDLELTSMKIKRR